MRSGDRSIWTRLSALKEKYSVLWMAVTWFLIALGFGFRTPAMATKELQAQIDVIRSTIARADTSQQKFERMLNIQFRLQCVDARISERDRQLAGLDCRTLSPAVVSPP